MKITLFPIHASHKRASLGVGYVSEVSPKSGTGRGEKRKVMCWQEKNTRGRKKLAKQTQTREN